MLTAVETSRWQGPALQSPLPANVQPLSGRARGLHAGVGLVRERPAGRNTSKFASSRRGCGSRTSKTERLSASTATRFSMMQCQCAYRQLHHRPGHDRSSGWSGQASGARRARCSPRSPEFQRRRRGSGAGHAASRITRMAFSPLARCPRRRGSPWGMAAISQRSRYTTGSVQSRPLYAVVGSASLAWNNRPMGRSEEPGWFEFEPTSQVALDKALPTDVGSDEGSVNMYDLAGRDLGLETRLNRALEDLAEPILAPPLANAR